MGLRLQDRKGDAVILEAIEPAVQLDEYLNDLAAPRRAGPEPPQARRRRSATLVHTLGKAELGHDDLHLGNFLLHDGKVYLIDAYAVRRGGMRTADVLQLGHSVSRFATRTDLLRGWATLGRRRPAARAATRSPSAAIDAFVQKASTGRNRYFGRLERRRAGTGRSSSRRSTRAGGRPSAR